MNPESRATNTKEDSVKVVSRVFSGGKTLYFERF